MMEEARPSPIPVPHGEEVVQEDTSAEEEKLRKRAERFGTEYVKPKPKSRKAHATQDNFKTGIDIYTKEELAKREERAARFHVECHNVTYQPLLDEDEDKKRERAARFGTEYSAVDHSGQQSEDLLEERKDHGAAVERRPDAIHLYGVDRMSTQECLAYFAEYGPRRVEWLDDSSCNVVFGDVNSAKRAVLGKGRPFSPGDAPDLQGLDPSNMDNLPFLWHKGEDFHKKGGKSKEGPVPLIFRIATVEDVKGMAPTKGSRYLWLNKDKGNARPAKRQFSQVDADGDVKMAGTRGGRKRTQKRLRAMPNGREIEMQDAEVPEEAGGEEGLQEHQGPDLREALLSRSKKAEGKHDSSFRMFTAEKAGVDIPEAVPKAEAENGSAHEGSANEDIREPEAMDAHGTEET